MRSPLTLCILDLVFIFETISGVDSFVLSHSISAPVKTGSVFERQAYFKITYFKGVFMSML